MHDKQSILQSPYRSIFGRSGLTILFLIGIGILPAGCARHHNSGGLFALRSVPSGWLYPEVADGVTGQLQNGCKVELVGVWNGKHVDRVAWTASGNPLGPNNYFGKLPELSSPMLEALIADHNLTPYRFLFRVSAPQNVKSDRNIANSGKWVFHGGTLMDELTLVDSRQESEGEETLAAYPKGRLVWGTTLLPKDKKTAELRIGQFPETFEVTVRDGKELLSSSVPVDLLIFSNVSLAPGNQTEVSVINSPS